MRSDVVVLGGGIAGLAVATWLRHLRPDRPPTVLLLEGRDRVGGKIRTDRDDGCIREWGPNGFLDNQPETLELVRVAGVEPRLVTARLEAANRYLYMGDGLWKLPGSQMEFVASRLLSFPAKLRILLEPFVGRFKGDDESVFAFAERRLGRQAAQRLVDPMVAGVFAGDARRLSLRSAFPRMAEMERDHGSLIRAMKARKKQAAAEGRAGGGPFGPGGALRSFDGGMEVLVEALREGLGDAVRTGKRAMGIERAGDGWRVQASDGQAFDAAAVVLALPAPQVAQVLGSLDERVREPLAGIPVPGVVAVALRFRREDAEKATRGFGFLVPSNQDCRVLGVLWESTIFPGRAPDGEVLIRCMVGGARAPGRADLSEADLVALVREELARTMGVTADPLDVRVFRHAEGIPQYVLGHAARLAELDAVLAEHPGLEVAGSSFRGVAMNKCIADAKAVAGRLLAARAGEAV